MHLTADVCAAYLGLTTNTVRHYCTDGKLAGAYKGTDGRWYIPLETATKEKRKRERKPEPTAEELHRLWRELGSLNAAGLAVGRRGDWVRTRLNEAGYDTSRRLAMEGGPPRADDDHIRTMMTFCAARYGWVPSAEDVCPVDCPALDNDGPDCLDVGCYYEEGVGR